MNYNKFLRFIFPAGRFDYFELSAFKEKPEQVEIYFEEKNIPLRDYATDKLERKEFYEAHTENQRHINPLAGMIRFGFCVLSSRQG